MGQAILLFLPVSGFCFATFGAVQNSFGEFFYFKVTCRPVFIINCHAGIKVLWGCAKYLINKDLIAI